MNKIVLFLLILSVVVISAGSGSCSRDYLAVTEDGYRINPPEEVYSGDPIGVNLTLKKVGILPREAILYISLNLVNPEVLLTIDDKTESFSNKIWIVYPLPSDGVETINIRVTGDAQDVDKKVHREIINVKTYVYYDQFNIENQTEKIGHLFVTNPVAEEAYDSIIAARDRVKDAEFFISSLKSLGADTEELEVKLQRIKEQIDIADAANDAGRPEDAITQVKLASKSLEGLISQAKSTEVGTQRRSAVGKLIIGGVLVIVLFLILFLRGYREELG